ncbi:MAG: hypothetical protein LBB98_04640 [Treponema sp.]|nr:hypothetical protein [Treponema sp.]
MKLIEKVKVGFLMRKVYEKIPKSLCQRLLESPDLPDEVKVELKQPFSRYNPDLLLKQVHRAVNALMTVYKRKSLRTKGPTASARI